MNSIPTESSQRKASDSWMVKIMSYPCRHWTERTAYCPRLRERYINAILPKQRKTQHWIRPLWWSSW